MEDRFTYQDFDLLIEPDPLGGYRARALRSPAGESAAVRFTLPFSPVELENLALKVSGSRRGTRGRGRPEIAPLKDFGGTLYDAVFTGELRDVLSRSLSQIRAQRVGMRLRLRLTDAPALAELPWEFLYDRRLNRFLARSHRTPLVRYLDLPDPPLPLAVDGPLRLLVMISSPRDWPKLDVEQEWSVLAGALAQPQKDGRVVIQRMTANMSTLRQRLRREKFHVFHFVGHGYYRSDWGDGVIVMEDAGGGPQEVTGEELGGLLNEYEATRLAVLNACEGAISDASDPFAGMAQSLIQQGLPAVVAMQFEITDDAAIIFARELYGAIADGFQLEAALAEARGAIRDVGNATEWGTPVLYSRAPDGHLFDLAARGEISEADRETREEADQAPEKADLRTRVQDDRNGSKDVALKAPEAGVRAGGEQVGSAGEERDVAGAGDQDVMFPPEPGDQLETDLAVPADQALADQAAAMEAMDPYDAADALIDRPDDQAAHILALMNPETAAKALAKLHDYGVAPEIVPFLESGALAKMLDKLGPWDQTVRILESAEARLAAATLSEMSWRSSLLREIEPEIAAAIIDEMTPRELDKTLNIEGSISPDPLDHLIDNISRERSLYLMSRIQTHRAADLLVNMTQRNPARADEFLREMKPGLAGRIFGEMDPDAALGWLTRMDTAVSARLLETMPPKKAAILLKRIEPSDTQELMSHMKPERLFYVRKIMERPDDQAPADED